MLTVAVAPVLSLLPLRVTAPELIWRLGTPPPAEMVFARVVASVRLKASLVPAPVTVTAPEPRAPAVPPLPTCKVPPDSAVPPE